jgi:hypothetical protein
MSCHPCEIHGRGALIGWCVPIALIVLGTILEAWILWFWIPAFLAIGITCWVNASRCGRIHCYATAPLFLVAALLLGLIAAGLLPDGWVGEIGLVVLAGVILAYGVEFASGRRYAVRS